MRKSIFWSVLIVLFTTPYVDSNAAEESFQVSTPIHEATISYQAVDKNSILVSVSDAENNPILGLTAKDFVIYKGQKKARTLLVEPLEKSKEVGLNIVFVVDNSASMKHRKAISPLLSAYEEFFRTVRPIDNIHVVVFNKKPTMKVAGHPLRVKTFNSNDIPKLRDFLRHSLTLGLTDKTVLYEAMLAGIDIVRNMPAKAHKFLVVFSDGEDINSTVEISLVGSTANKIPNFEAYSIDYMPVPSMDPFLKNFAERHGGRIWKATSATQLLPIFESFSTSLLHRYVVSYRVLDPPHGTLSIEPAELNFDMLTMTDGSTITDYIFFETGKSKINEKYVLFANRRQAKFFEEEKLKTALDRYYNVLNLVGERLKENPTVQTRIVGCNSDVGTEKGNHRLSLERAKAVKDYLNEVWEIEANRMTVQGRNLPAEATPKEVLGGQAENQRVEITYDLRPMQDKAAGKFIVEKGATKAIKARPNIVAEYGISDWQISLAGNDQELRSLSGADDLKPSYAFSFDELGREKLASLDHLNCRIKVTDIYGDTLETTTKPCPIKITKKEIIHELIPPLDGVIAVLPDSITIEEITTIDTSPLLNYVFFETGESTIPKRYLLFVDQANTKDFTQSRLRGTMEKYHHLLNIVGKRLQDNPEANITLVGCNSNYGPEKVNISLSQLRAEAVKAYLRYVWMIDPSRIIVKARNLPSAPSTNRITKGRLENQRVEIYSDSPAILNTVDSTYIEETSDTKEIQIMPKIQAGYGIVHWKLGLTSGEEILASVNGEEGLNSIHSFNLRQIGLRKISSYENISAKVEVENRKGQNFTTGKGIGVKFIKRKERVAQKMGYKVLEKYALILFDFDSSEIKDQNEWLVGRILERTSKFPDAKIKVVGHTDNIGNEDYNLKLSERRAKAVYDQLLESGTIGTGNITHKGVGLNDPLYDNDLSEGRALNRTVTVYLEYEKEE